MEINSEFQALEELVDEARTAEQIDILRAWYDEIKNAADSQGEEIPKMSFTEGVLEFGDTVMIFPIEKRLLDLGRHESYDEIEDENKKNDKNKPSNTLDSTTKELLRLQRTHFIGQIATSWIRDGYRVRVHRGFRAWGAASVFDIVTRLNETGEDAIAECEKPGHAAFLLRADEGEWRESFTETKQIFTAKTKQGIGYRMIHVGDTEEWNMKATAYFEERKNYERDK